MVDNEALGYGVLAFVFVDQDAFDVPDIAERFRAIPNVLECHSVAGEWSFLLKVRAGDTADLEQVLQAIRRVEAVNRTHSVIGLSTAFESTMLPAPKAEPEDGDEPPQLMDRP